MLTRGTDADQAALLGGYCILWGDAKELHKMNKISQKLKNKPNFKNKF